MIKHLLVFRTLNSSQVVEINRGFYFVVSLDSGLFCGLTRAGMMWRFLSWVHSVESKIFFAGLEFKWLEDFGIVRYFNGLLRGFSGMVLCENFEFEKQIFVLIFVKWDKILLMWCGLMNILRLDNCQI